MCPAARGQPEWADYPMPYFQQTDDDSDLPPMPVFPRRTNPVNTVGSTLSPSSSTGAIRTPHPGLKDSRNHPYARPVPGAHTRVAGGGEHQHTTRTLPPTAHVAGSSLRVSAGGPSRHSTAGAADPSSALDDIKRFHDDQRRRAEAGVLEERQRPAALPQLDPPVRPRPKVTNWVAPPIKGGPGPDSIDPTSADGQALSFIEWLGCYRDCISPLVEDSYQIPREAGDDTPWERLIVPVQPAEEYLHYVLRVEPGITAQKFYKLLVPPRTTDRDGNAVDVKYTMPGALINKIHKMLDKYVKTPGATVQGVAAAVSALWIVHSNHGRARITKRALKFFTSKGYKTVEADFYQRCAFEVAHRIAPDSVSLPSRLAVCPECAGRPVVACFILVPVHKESCLVCWTKGYHCPLRTTTAARVRRGKTNDDLLDLPSEQNAGTTMGEEIDRQIASLR